MTAENGPSLRSPYAVHLEGGNYFDDMRIDIARSHERLDDLPRRGVRERRSRLANAVRRGLVMAAIRLRVHEFLILNGIRRRWLDEFERYWSEVLGGRPFWNSIEFFLLTHDYRKRQQQTGALAWAGPEQHVAHWQNPSQLYATFHQVRKLATRPIVSRPLWRRLSADMRILELGCSLAPYYNCYREYYSHVPCQWLLADLANYPFHYARYRYRDDPGLTFHVITPNKFTDPLPDVEAFDVIILTAVLEHADDPVFLADYVLDRLKPGGLFVFDYIKSDARGLDHPHALASREACLMRILARTTLLYGSASNIAESIGTCIAVKRESPVE